MTNFELPTDNPDANLLGRNALPGEEFSYEDNGNVVTVLCDQVKSIAVTPSGDMTCEKTFDRIAVEPRDNVKYALIPQLDDHVSFDPQRGVMVVTRTSLLGVKGIVLFPASEEQ